jgi:hypothetical protein
MSMEEDDIATVVIGSLGGEGKVGFRFKVGVDF